MTRSHSRRLTILEARCAPDDRDPPRYARPGMREAAFLETLSIPELRSLRDVLARSDNGRNLKALSTDQLRTYKELSTGWDTFIHGDDAR